MQTHTLTHLNVVRPVGAFNAEIDEFKYFMGMLAKIFAHAKVSDDIKWHDHGGHTNDGRFIVLPEIVALKTERTEDNPIIMTMAGWPDFKSFRRFTYGKGGLHVEGMTYLKDWVDRSVESPLTLWWQPRGVKVDLAEAWRRRQHLIEYGPTPEAFTPQKRFPAPDES